MLSSYKTAWSSSKSGDPQLRTSNREFRHLVEQYNYFPTVGAHTQAHSLLAPSFRDKSLTTCSTPAGFPCVASLIPFVRRRSSLTSATQRAEIRT